MSHCSECQGVCLLLGRFAQAGREQKEGSREGADSHTAYQREGLRRGVGASLAHGWGTGGVRVPCPQMGSWGCCGLMQMWAAVTGAEQGPRSPLPSPHPSTWPRALPTLLFQTSPLDLPSTESPPQHVVHK